MMKRILISILFSVSCYLTVDAQRYLTEIFTNAQLTITPNQVYANNYSFLTGSPVATDLKMDIYAPSFAADPGTLRPLVIYLPTGSFLPPVVNGTPTGSRTDSACVAMCTQFAKRGYVAAIASYRLGWNPVAVLQDIRTGTLLQAVYRAVQDAKSCVRYFYSSAANGNTYSIDTTRIIIGGQGSGGYLALAYATLDQPTELNIPKFLADTTIINYGFFQGQSYVQTGLWGDFDGHGGDPMYNRDSNSLGYSTKVHFIFNMGGALGDSSWLEAGDAPMVAFHVMGDPFAPFGDGPVIVPTTGQFVVDVSGSKTVITKANALGNNNCFKNAGFTDPYTLRANQVNLGQDGLFPFEMIPPTQAGPWEWFDLQSTRNYAQALGYPPSEGDSVYLHALYTNPNMSKAKALAYIDTIQNYVNPRIVYCLGLNTGIGENEALAYNLSAMPNPSSNDITLQLNQVNNRIVSLAVYDITGRMMRMHDGINSTHFRIERKNIEAGIYVVRVRSEKGETSIRIIFN